MGSDLVHAKPSTRKGGGMDIFVGDLFVLWARQPKTIERWILKLVRMPDPRAWVEARDTRERERRQRAQWAATLAQDCRDEARRRLPTAAGARFVNPLQELRVETYLAQSGSRYATTWPVGRRSPAPLITVRVATHPPSQPHDALISIHPGGETFESARTKLAEVLTRTCQRS